MKYSETLIKKTIAAIENHPEHTFWHVHKRSQCDDLGFCEIRFESIDSVKMSISICKNEVNAIVYTDDSCNGYKWLGSCSLDNINNDFYMMWLGIKLTKMHDFAARIAEAE